MFLKFDHDHLISLDLSCKNHEDSHVSINASHTWKKVIFCEFHFTSVTFSQFFPLLCHHFFYTTTCMSALLFHACFPLFPLLFSDLITFTSSIAVAQFQNAVMHNQLRWLWHTSFPLFRSTVKLCDVIYSHMDIGESAINIFLTIIASKYPFRIKGETHPDYAWEL